MAMMNPGCLFCILSQTQELTQALEHIQICREVWKSLKASGTLYMNNKKNPLNVQIKK